MGMPPMMIASAERKATRVKTKGKLRFVLSVMVFSRVPKGFENL